MALFFRSDLKFRAIQGPIGIESVWCKFYFEHITIIIGVFYRPPGSSADSLITLTNFISEHNYSSGNIILMGDFNAPGIQWSTLSLSDSPSLTDTELLKFSLFLGLTQVVREFTRESAVLDLVFVSPTLLESTFNCLVTEGISDHKAVFVSLSCRVPTPNIVYSTHHDFNRADDVSILTVLEDSFENFERLSESSDVNDLVSFFESLVHSCITRFIPIKTKKKNVRLPWMTRELLQLTRRVKRLHCSIRRQTSPSLNEFNKLKEELRAKTKAAKDFYYQVTMKNLMVTNPRKFWSSILPSSTEPNTMDIDGASTSDPVTIANAFNSYFKSVFTIDNFQTPTFSLANPAPSIGDVCLSEEGILNLILNLDTKKSPGPDNIPNNFLVRYASCTSRYLMIIYKKSLATATVPLSWKLAKVLPFFKAGCKSSPANYRPISLTSHSCKILEHVIYKHIVEFLEANNILNQFQHGFRRGFSTITQLTEFSHDVIEAIDSGYQVDAIFIDLSKAFDTVLHSKLLLKLNFILKNPLLVGWISSFLSHRSQYVFFNSTASSTADVTSGVPQGSVLGPLLFLLFINDISGNITSQIRLYADDCVIYQKITSAEDHEKLNNSFSNFCTWCQTWQMNVNFQKTVCMTFSTRSSAHLFPYSFDGCHLTRKMEYKYLGLHFTHNMSWSKHIDITYNKALKRLGYLQRVLRVAPKETKLLTFKTLVRPLLEYGCVVWNPHKASDIAKLESIQKKKPSVLSAEDMTGIFRLRPT